MSTLRDLPDTWRWADFGAIAHVASNLVDPLSYPDLPHIAPNHIQSKTGRLLPYTTVAGDGVTSPKNLFCSGQILYSKIRPYLAKAILATFTGLCSADMYPLETALNPNYLLYWLLTNEFTQYASLVQGRTVLPKINRGQLERLPVPIAPMQEQEKIVAAIEEQLSRLDAGTAALERVRRKLTQVRAAVLQAAISGELIAGDHDEPSLASELPPTAVIQPPYPDRPPNWITTTISAIAHVTSGATPSRGQKEYWTNGSIPWITSALVNNETIASASEYITPLALEKTPVKLMPIGTLLVAMYGEGRTRGHCSELLIEATTNQACAGIVLNESWAFVMPFLKLVLKASYEANRRLSSGGVQPNLSVGIIKRLSVSLPPRNEQRRICEEVAAQLSLIDQLDAALSRGLTLGNRLRASILDGAFSGRLVPQDPTDEPASVLLGRIAAERATSNGHMRRSQKKVTS